MKTTTLSFLTFTLMALAIFNTSLVEATKPKPPKTQTEPAVGFNHNHQIWTEELSKYVTLTPHASTVDYKTWKKNQGPLNTYLKKLSDVSPKVFKSFNEKQQQAFLINAYNAFTISLVLKNYPVDSIKDIGNIFSSTWKKKFFTLLGETRYLDWIEHEKLRKDYKEPRVHFAVNCASIGCPRLANKAFTAENLDSLLDEQAKAFLTDTSRNKYDAKKKELTVSKIFKWFSEDFEGKDKSVQKFIIPYMGITLPEGTEPKDLKLEYSDYDWKLNRTPKK